MVGGFKQRSCFQQNNRRLAAASTLTKGGGLHVQKNMYRVVRRSSVFAGNIFVGFLRPHPKGKQTIVPQTLCRALSYNNNPSVRKCLSVSCSR